jgi:hypothetical protein
MFIIKKLQNRMLAGTLNGCVSIRERDVIRALLLLVRRSEI